MEKGKRILIVDDEPSIRLVFPKMIEKAGYSNISTFSSGDELLEKVENWEGVCLMFIDLQMPGTWGDEVISQLKNKGLGFPMVLMTGNLANWAQKRVRGSKADYSLQKPVSAGGLLEVVARYIA